MVARTWGLLVGAGLIAVGLTLPGGIADAGVAHDRPAATDPADWTPFIEDGGGVFGVATVGDVTVAGGSFTTVRNRDGSTLTRNNIVAFTPGGVSTSFVPTVGARVWDVVPSGDGATVFIGGQFNNVSGRPRTSRVARIDVATGAVVSSFRSPGFDGKVTDLHLANGRLYVGGYFRTVGGQPHTGLVALDPDTGALTDHLDGIVFADLFNSSTRTSVPSGNSGVGVEKFTVSPDGSRLVAVGNFRTVSRQARVQVAMLDTSGASATLTDWSTDRYAMTCSRNFPTYTLGVDLSPDGTWFVISTGGAYSGGVGAGTLCDTVARWETHHSGPGQQPTWVDYLGGDTGNAVHTTGSTVYLGGHFRWVNNPYAADTVGPGTVKRSGLAALDARNGLPYRFNASKLPLRWGVMRFVSTDDGLWVAHDGDRLGGEDTGRLGMLPLAGAAKLPPDFTGSLPGDAFLLGAVPAPTGPSPVLHRVNAGGPAVASTDGHQDWAADDGWTSPVRNGGSSTATSSQDFLVTSAVPTGTPRTIFNTERYDPSGEPEMQWDFPVEAGLPVQVRLYFANGYSGTSSVGQRVFDVAVDGATVLDDYDIVVDAGGTSVGTMRAFDLVSDGNVDIDFTHLVENPLVNGIEIVRTDITPEPTTPTVLRTALTESGAGARTTIPDGGIDWSAVRGSFMVDGRLYTGWADGTFTWRSFTGTRFGGARTVNLNGLTAFASELGSVRAMWFDRATGRLYFTRHGHSELSYRYFTPESTVVGAVPFTAPDTGAGIDWSRVTGGFLADGRLWFSDDDGHLRSGQWQDGVVPGTTALVSGPDVDGLDWGSGSLFLLVR